MQKEIAGKAETEKHINLMDAIGDLDQVIHRGRDLVMRIGGVLPSEKKDPVSDVTSVPKLIDVLNMGPSEIRSKCGELNEVLCDIESVLF